MCSTTPRPRSIVAEDQEQVDKILSLQDRAAASEACWSMTTRAACGTYDDPFLKSFEEVQAAGRDFGAAHPGYRRGARSLRASPDDLALFSYTSGTTGAPERA